MAATIHYRIRKNKAACGMSHRLMEYTTNWDEVTCPQCFEAYRENPRRKR